MAPLVPQTQRPDAFLPRLALRRASSVTTMEDQKKRTLEALKRRFAQAKAEVDTQQHKGKKRPIADTKRVASNTESPSVDSTLKRPSFDASSKKGKFSFWSHTHKQDVEVNEPAYLKLSHTVHENLLPHGAEDSDGNIIVNRVLHDLLQRGDAAQKYNQGSRSLKIENNILLDNFVPKNSMLRARALQNESKRSKKHMSLKQHKRSGLFDLPKEFHKFGIFKPMHDKWKAYIQQLLKIIGKDQLAQCFLNADLHGAIMLVVQCKIVVYVGIHGIMVRETKETFGIITQDNKFRVCAEKGFRICAPSGLLEDNT
ncbi:hypothetical protein OROGR_017594 [Orobanche gracilis]